MESLASDVLSEVLAFLTASEIGRLASGGRTWNLRIMSMGGLSDACAYRKVVSASDWASKYADHFLLQHVPGTSGAVTFRFPVLRVYPSAMARKLLLQSLTINRERDAVLWLARGMGVSSPPRSVSSAVFLARDLPWDLMLYRVVCYALKASPLPCLHLHVRSVPAMHDGQRKLPSSSQAFLCNLLCQTKGKIVHLHLGATYEDLPHVPVTSEEMQAERRRVNSLLDLPNWSERVDLYAEHDFRSSTVAIGAVLAMSNPDIRSLELSHYIFDETGSSMDVQSLVAWLGHGPRSLTRVHLHGVSFSTGDNFCDVLRALCSVPTLQTLHLSVIEHHTEAPVDPLAILFERGGHLRDLRLGNVMRTNAEFPFLALPAPGFRCLGLTRMFLDTSSVRPLVLLLPTLSAMLSLDLSCNGIDGTALALFAMALKHRGCRLRRLKMSSNILTSTKILPFCDALAVNLSLQHIDLSDNFLGTQSCLSLVRTMLVDNRCLKYMNLDCNQARITMEDMYRVMLAMPAHDAGGVRRPFRQISLRSNPIFFEKRNDGQMYTHFFASTFNVSLKF